MDSSSWVGDAGTGARGQPSSPASREGACSMTDASASKASVDGSLRRFTEDRASEPDNPRHAGWPDLLQPASRRGQLLGATGTCAPDAFLLPVPACGTSPA